MPSTPDIDVSALAEALNEKLDRDGYNATNDIKEMMANMGMPSDRYIDLTLPATGGYVIAPDDGYITIEGYSNGGSSNHVGLNSDKVRNLSEASWNAGYASIPVSKNDSVRVWYASVTITVFRFYYANGSAHLAQNS